MRLRFEGEEKRTSEIKVIKDGKKWVYFIAISNRCKYRMNKQTGEIQVAPYWYKTKMYVDYLDV